MYNFSMALLDDMPAIAIDRTALREWGEKWNLNKAFSKKEGMDFGTVFDQKIGQALATMLGGINVITPSQRDLLPKQPDAVEVGPVRMIGGIRPQNYDVGYRPDGVRFVFDSKTLNETKSVGKNFQNMVNDLATEATTVHIRFPYAVVGFLVAIPSPCLTGDTRKRFTRMLDRLVGRNSPIDLAHKAEAVSFVLWNPDDGTIDTDWPEPDSRLRLERFSEFIQEQYRERYDGMSPHDKPSAAQKTAMEATGEVVPEPEEDHGNSAGD